MAAAALPLDQADEPEEYEEQEHAEQVPDPDRPPTYGENNREMPEQLTSIIESLLKTFAARDQYDRRIEVLMDRKLRFYDDGIQHFYANLTTGVYQVGTAGAYVNLPNGEKMQCPEYMGAYNIFRARRRSIHAVLTQNPPGVDFVPNKLGIPEGEQSAEIAEGYRHFFDQANDVKAIQEAISRMMCLSGRVVSRTHTTKDAQRWGFNEQGDARQMETAKIYGTLESRVPITCRDYEKMPFCFLYEDPDVTLARSQNPWIRKKIKPGEASPGESDWERYARLGIKQARKGVYLTGSAITHLVTELHAILRPAAFEETCCDDVCTAEPPEGYEWQTDDEGNVTYRDALQQLFPEGIHCVYIGKCYAESWNEAMDDSIDVGFPDSRDGMTGGALLEPMVVIQDVYNDYKNAERENYEKGWPATYFKGSEQDYNAIADTRSAPAQFHLLKDGDPTVPIDGNVVFREPDFTVPATFVEAMEDLRGNLSQDVTGALPALQGASGDEKTASGQAMDRSQAMGMLGPAWSNLQRMWAGIYYKAALLASKNPDHGKEIAVARGDGTKTTIQLSQIRKGTFRAKPDVDSSFPDSTSSKRANLMQLLQLVGPTPLGAALMQSPDNWEEFLELNGNPDFKLIPAIAFKKQMRELELLLEQAPVTDPVQAQQYDVQHATQAITAQAQGMPAPPYQPPQQPSIMPEPDDFHQWESAKCAEYLSSEDCWLRQNTGTPEQIQQAQLGIQNVRLHKGVHDQMLAMQQPPMPPAMPIKTPPPAPGGNAPEAGSQVQQNAAPPGAGAPTI